MPNSKEFNDGRVGERIDPQLISSKNEKVEKRLHQGCRELAMAGYLGIRALTEDAHIVIASSPSMFLGPVAQMVAKARRAWFLWDVRDLTWRYAEEQAKSLIARWLCRHQSRWMLHCARKADIVTCANEGIANSLASSGVAQEKIVVE